MILSGGENGGKGVRGRGVQGLTKKKKSQFNKVAEGGGVRGRGL